MHTQSKNPNTSMFHESKLDQFRLFCDINKANYPEYYLKAVNRDGGWVLNQQLK